MPVVEVKRIEVVQTALTLAVVAAVLGLIEGILVAAGGSALMPLAGTPVAETIAAGTLSIIVLPIVSFIVTFIGVAIAAIIYNLVAERIGGIKFQS